MNVHTLLQRSSFLLMGFIGLLLFILGWLKLGAERSALDMQLLDPVFELPFRTVVTWSGIGEVAIGSAMFFFRKHFAIPLVLLCFTMCLCAYRGAAAVLHPEAYCPCLGSLPAQLGLDDGVSGYLSLSLLLVMFFAGLSGILIARSANLAYGVDVGRHASDLEDERVNPYNSERCP